MIHLFKLWKAVNQGFTPQNQAGQENSDFAETLYVAIIGWFAVLVDQSKDGMDVFPLWKQLFPRHGRAIDRVWKKIEPDWILIRDFRDNVAFHSAKPKKYFDVRLSMHTEKSRVVKALDAFVSLQACLTRRESKELSDFVTETENLLLDMELDPGCNIPPEREWFKKRLILPRGNFRKMF